VLSRWIREGNGSESYYPPDNFYVKMHTLKMIRDYMKIHKWKLINEERHWREHVSTYKYEPQIHISEYFNIENGKVNSITNPFLSRYNVK
jgi:hypothetical protein